MTVYGDGGLGIGDGGLGIGDWAHSPIPTPQSPIPNPQSPIPNPQMNYNLFITIKKLFNFLYCCYKLYNFIPS